MRDLDVALHGAGVANNQEDAEEPTKELSWGSSLREAGVPGLGEPSDSSGSMPSWRPGADLSTVERYGRFEILGRVGKGGMAEILLARERNATGAVRHLAIKRVLRDVVDDVDMVDMFLDEARLVMGLSHPNLCQIFDVGREGKSWFIAMEWVHGVTLSQILRRAHLLGRVDELAVTRIIKGVAEALHHVHGSRGDDGMPLNLVHRDVSPHNIMVAYDGRVKLLDFGIAKADNSTHRTEAGVVKGKFCYMAPEQWLGEKLDGRTDVFALGLCLYEALTGKVLFKRGTQAGIMRAILDYEVADILGVRPSLDRKLADVVHRAIARRPEDRYQTGGEMAEALESYLHAQSAGSAFVVADHVRALFSSELRRGPEISQVTPMPGMPAVDRDFRLVGGGAAPGEQSDVTRGAGLGVDPAAGATGVGLEEIEELDIELAESLPPSGRDSEVDRITAPRLQAATATARTEAGGGTGLVRLATVGALSLLVSLGLVSWWFSSGPRQAETQGGPVVESAAVGGSARQIAGPEDAPVEPVGTPGTVGQTVVGETGAVSAAAPPSSTDEGGSVAKVAGEGRVEGSESSDDGTESSDDGTESSDDGTERTPDGAAATGVVPAGAKVTGEVSEAAGETVEQPVTGEEPSTRTGSVSRRAYLSINTQPWSRVYLGKRLLGTTPIANVRVPAGTLRLRFVDRDGREHRRRISGSSKRTREAYFDFDASP